MVSESSITPGAALCCETIASRFGRWHHEPARFINS
jgi:hypothetical protein